MITFRDEQPFSEQIKSSLKASYELPIKLSETRSSEFEDSLKSMSKDKREFKRLLAKIGDNPNPELMYGSAILVSTNWNKNDEIFLPAEVWKAKDSPVNTPFNDDHVEDDIIGHIISSDVVDKDNVKYEGSEIPDYYSLLVNFVIYKEIFPEIAEEITELAPLGEKFVSMEARIKNFDYGLMGKDGELKVVSRNEDTAFLTKYLRIYGGEGEYEGYKLGRVLRQINFVGMGNVDKPANPESIYVSIENVKASEITCINSMKTKILYISKGNNMLIETVDQAKEVITSLEAKITDLNKTVKDQGDKLAASEASKTEVTSAKVETESKLVAESAKVEIASKEIETLKASIAEVNSKLEEKVKANDYLDKALEEYKKADQAAKRNKVIAELGFEVTQDFATKLSSMDEASFNAIVEYTKSVKAAKPEDDKDDKDAKEKKDKKDKEDKSKAEELAALEAAKETPVIDPNTIAAQNETKAQDIKTLAGEAFTKMFETIKASQTPKKKKK